MDFTTYSRTIDRLALCYDGFLPEYAIQLDYILPFIRQTGLYADAQVRHEFLPLTSHCKDHLDLSTYAFVQHFTTDPSGAHPIYEFIKGMIFPKVEVHSNKKICLICPD